MLGLWPWMCALLTGVLLALCYPGWDQGWLVWIALTPLIAAHFGWEMSFVTAASVAVLGGAAWLVIDPLKAWHEPDTGSKKSCTANN